MSGVQVVADGNPRQGGMDEDECEQCIHGAAVGYGFVVWRWSDDACKDIISWFKRKTTLSDAVETNADIEALEKELGTEIPTALRSLLTKQSGGIWFDDYLSLPAGAIISTAESLGRDSGWKASYIPFATNVDGAALITDVNARNSVFEFGDDGKGRQLAPTMLQFIEEFRNRLLSGQFDFVEDVGLVERSRK